MQILQNLTGNQITINNKEYKITFLKQFVKTKDYENIDNSKLQKELRVLIINNVAFAQFKNALETQKLTENKANVLFQALKAKDNPAVQENLQALIGNHLLIQGKLYDIHSLKNLSQIQTFGNSTPLVFDALTTLTEAKIDFNLLKTAIIKLKHSETQKNAVLLHNFQSRVSILKRLQKLNQTHLQIGEKIFSFQALLTVN